MLAEEACCNLEGWSTPLRVRRQTDTPAWRGAAVSVPASAGVVRGQDIAPWLADVFLSLRRFSLATAMERIMLEEKAKQRKRREGSTQRVDRLVSYFYLRSVTLAAAYTVVRPEM